MSFLNNIGVVWYNLYCNSHIFDSDTYIAAKWWPVMSSLRFLPREATRIILHTERWSVVIDHFRLVNQQSSVSSIIPSWNVLGIVCSRLYVAIILPLYLQRQSDGKFSVNKNAIYWCPMKKGAVNHHATPTTMPDICSRKRVTMLFCPYSLSLQSAMQPSPLVVTSRKNGLSEKRIWL